MKTSSLDIQPTELTFDGLSSASHSAKTLWDTKPGDQVLVHKVDHTLQAVVLNRLSDIGIDIGAQLLCLRRAPFGGPLVVLVADCVYTLDQQIASRIFLQA